MKDYQMKIRSLQKGYCHDHTGKEKKKTTVSSWFGENPNGGKPHPSLSRLQFSSELRGKDIEQKTSTFNFRLW